MTKGLLIIMIMLFALTTSCTKEEQNPFFTEWKTPFGTPPFNEIENEDYLPAFKEGIRLQQEEIAAITANKEAPTFANTIDALERSGKLLDKVSGVFYNLNSALTSDTMQQIAKEVSPLLSKHHDDINLNAALFARIKSLYEQKSKLNLTVEQNTLLEKYYKDFVRGGANLNDADKEKLRKTNKELSLLSLKFGENVLKENNRFEMVLENKEDLSGLPRNVIAAAAEAAKERGHEGKWVFTLHKPSLIPFIQYSDKRELREKMFKGYITRGDHNDELDNKEIIRKMVNLRIEKAQLLGYKSHADFVLEENMAKTPENVYNLLDKIWDPALVMAKREAAELQKIIYKSGGNFKLMPWDWWYYAEKLRKEKYELDEEVLRPYFKLENVRDGAFEVAHKLYGITFSERNDIPVYHKDVKVFELKEANGKHIGILYTDYFPRASKRGGAWMEAYRKESNMDGKKVTPIICNVCNFSKPTGDKPALLSFEEVLTLFHEFGHALHGLLSDCIYPSLSGTSVARDFVETFSQIMENWASEPQVLKMYARHYKTGEPIPQELIEKIKNSGHFNQGFATVEYLAASYLDMDWHTLTQVKDYDVNKFEIKAMNKIHLIPEIIERYRSTYFSHIFAGSYSSGYYSYIWAEVLDADAFQAFKENGIFDQKTAESFRKNILSRGGTEEAMVLYKRFRGREPDITPLLERRGLLEK